MRKASVGLCAAVLAALGAAPSAFAAATASVTGTTLTVDGGATGDQIVVTLRGGDGLTVPAPCAAMPCPPEAETTPSPYIVEDLTGPVTAGAGCTAVNANRAECGRLGQPWGGFTVRINGGTGADWLQIVRPIQAAFDPVVVHGGADGDAIFGSQTGDTISGDAGDDLIDGGAGQDALSGGTLNSPVPSYEGGVDQPTSYSPGPGAGTDRVYGGNFDDQITDGDHDADPSQLNSDVIDGGTCNTTTAPSGQTLPPGVTAPAGVTSCPALPGNVDGPEDHDAYMLGHRTKDLVVDILVESASQGAAGENEMVHRIEAVWAGSGNDRLYGRDGDLGDESLRGNAGNDYLEARGGDDELIGGDGQDHLVGGAGADILWPGGHIISARDAPTEMVSDGPDMVEGGTNSTIVGGHSQTDLITYDGRTDNLRIDLSRPNTLGAPGENDVVTGVEDIMGGSRDDVIVGDGVQNLISGDPAAFVFNVPPDPPAYPPAPGGHAGNDQIDTRGDGPDTVDCGGGNADVHLSDAVDGSINCENKPPPPTQCSDGADNDSDGRTDFPNDPGCENAADTSESPDPAPGATIGGPRSAGSVTVKKDGSFTLTKNVVQCPAGSANCKVTTTITPTKGKTKLGSLAYTLRAARKGGARSKLSKKRLSQLKRRRSMKTRVAIKAVVNGKAASKTVTVTLKPPKKSRRR